MLDRGLVTPVELRAALAAMQDRLFRFPAVDPSGLANRLERVLERD